MEKTWEEIMNAAERLDWSVHNLSDEGCFVPDGMTQLEFKKHSPAGEEFSFAIESSSPSGMAAEISQYAANFDTEEHIKSIMGMRGAPNLRTLVWDADDIQDMLNELAEAIICDKEESSGM